MDTPATPTVPARDPLEALIALRDELQKMHAELEYLRLMLRIAARG